MRKVAFALLVSGLMLSACTGDPAPATSAPPTPVPGGHAKVVLVGPQSIDGWSALTDDIDERDLDAYFLWKGLITAVPTRAADLQVTLVAGSRLLSAAVIAVTGAGPAQLAAAMARMPEDRGAGVEFALKPIGDAAAGCAPAPGYGLYCAWIDGASIGLMRGVGTEAESLALMLKVRATVVKPA